MRILVPGETQIKNIKYFKYLSIFPTLKSTIELLRPTIADCGIRLMRHALSVFDNWIWPPFDHRAAAAPLTPAEVTSFCAFDSFDSIISSKNKSIMGVILTTQNSAGGWFKLIWAVDSCRGPSLFAILHQHIFLDFFWPTHPVPLLT